MDYRLEGLSTRSFEQLVQALAAQVIAPGVVIFGDGPDGGREATFDGQIPYPSPTDRWEGYLVVQAKFRQLPAGTSRDADWAISELRKELDAYGREDSHRRPPEYFIFATNVRLSAVRDSGAKDRAESVLAQAAEGLGLKGYAVWDYYQLCAYLDATPEIRRAYAAWITSGDVLSEMMSAITGMTPAFDDVLGAYLQRELLTDQFANLEQAGRAADERIPISQVFVDLPVRDPQVAGGTGPGTGYIARLLQLASLKLDDTLGGDAVGDFHGSARTEGPGPNRQVLVGGPGQGKTTLGQFVCQLFRAAVLASRPQATLSAEVRDALEQLRTHCGQEGIPVPSVRRFPVRVVLNRLASALAADDGPTSVLEYLSRMIAQRTSREVNPNLLLRWLTHYPWFFVMDGLDEVPASANRDAVLDAIRDFWVDLSAAQSDVLVLATTRPQGYNDAFSPRLYVHRHLAPLSPERALHYADRLVSTRFAGDEERRTKIRRRLARAASAPATARLMRTPLQVTIMTTLVDRMGQPPQERWSLFNAYYNVVYQREVERDIPAAEILRDYRPDIDAIHRRVGLLLQVESELAEQTEAKLPASRLESVVDERLREEGHQGLERITLKRDITRAASERLVFLVGLEADEVGFEIRSLQEFMAAEGLVDGGDDVVAARLGTIAPAVAWRNVFLFAAGKCFAERQHLRDTIYRLCAELNSMQPTSLARSISTGGHLALDLLEDGPPRRQPKYEELLVTQALELVEQPPHDAHFRLLALYEERLAGMFRVALERALRAPDCRRRLGAWHVLLRLGSTEDWASGLAEGLWPSDAGEANRILAALPLRDVQGWTEQFVYQACEQLPPEALDALDLSRPDQSATSAAPTWLAEFLVRMDYGADRPGHKYQLANGEGRDSLRLRVISVEDSTEFDERGLAALGRHGDDAWALVRAGAEFAQAPSAATLAQALRSITPEAWILRDRSTLAAPWPLATCIASAASHGELDLLATAAENGQLGDRHHWHEAEARWRARGITDEDIKFTVTQDAPISPEIATIGFPLAGTGWEFTVTKPAVAPLRARLDRWFSFATSPAGRASVGQLLLAVKSRWFNEPRTRERLEPERFAAVLNSSMAAAPPFYFNTGMLNAMDWSRPISAEVVDSLETAASSHLMAHYIGLDAELVSPTLAALRPYLDRPSIGRLITLALPVLGPTHPSIELLRNLPTDLSADASDLLTLKTAPSLEGLEATARRLFRSPDPLVVDNAVETFSLRAQSEDAVGFGVAAYESLGVDACAPSQRLFTTLTQMLSRYTSGLETTAVWNELQLFEPSPPQG